MSRIVDVLRRDRALISVSPEDTVQTAVETMARNNVGAVLVLDGPSLAGIFTERDLTRRVVAEGRAPTETPVREVMTPDVVVVQADTPHTRVLKLMQTRHFRHAPVAEGTALVGVVSIRDLLRFEKEHAEAEIVQLKEYVYTFAQYPA